MAAGVDGSGAYGSHGGRGGAAEPAVPPVGRQCFTELTLDLGDLLLRPLQAGDIDAIVEGCSDPATQRWVPVPSPYTEADARFYVETQDDFRTDGLGLRCAIALAQDNALVGSVGLNLTDWRQRVTEVGYWCHPTHRGAGHITRATRALSVWALDQGMERVELRAAPENTASNAVARRAGFTLEGTLRSAGIVHAGRVDLNVHSLISADRA